MLQRAIAVRIEVSETGRVCDDGAEVLTHLARVGDAVDTDMLCRHADHGETILDQLRREGGADELVLTARDVVPLGDHYPIEASGIRGPEQNEARSKRSFAHRFGVPAPIGGILAGSARQPELGRNAFENELLFDAPHRGDLVGDRLERPTRAVVPELLDDPRHFPSPQRTHSSIRARPASIRWFVCRSVLRSRDWIGDLLTGRLSRAISNRGQPTVARRIVVTLCAPSIYIDIDIKILQPEP